MKLRLSRSAITSLGLSAVALATAITISDDASAVGTRRFRFSKQKDFTSGKLRGTAVDSRGRLRAGWNLGKRTLSKASSIWSAVTLRDGSVLLGTGNDGKILKYSGGKVSVWAETKQLAVTSLVVGHGGTVYAATIPEGKIFKVEGKGKLKELPRIADVENVWQLAYSAKKKELVAATGPKGKVFRISAGGSAQLLFDSNDENIVSVTFDDKGNLYAGSGETGKIFRIRGAGRADVLFSCPGQEAKGLAFAKGSLFAICNKFNKLRPTRGRSSGARPARGKVGRGSKGGRGWLFRIESSGKSERLYHDKSTHFLSLALDDKGMPYVGTGKGGRVFKVDSNHARTLVADTDERQVSALIVSGKTKLIAASDPAVLHPIRGQGGNQSTWTSKVLDAGARAQFGKLTWSADGRVSFLVRTGNSKKADDTWSDWSPALSAPGKPRIKAGRYVQIRARFGDKNALLRDLNLAFVTDNLRAILTDVSVKGKKGSSSGMSSSGAKAPKSSAKVDIKWKTDNPDKDKLRYRVHFRFDGEEVWRPLTRSEEVYTKSSYSWDTTSLPEGRYRVKVEASDELANPPSRALTHSFESDVVLVDNTAPVFRSLRANGRRLVADVVDGLGPIAYVDVSVDGAKDWRPLQPKDGVFDDATEKFDADLTSIVGKGRHLVAVRAYDANGNFVVKNLEFKLGKPCARGFDL